MISLQASSLERIIVTNQLFHTDFREDYSATFGWEVAPLIGHVPRLTTFLCRLGL